jgi:pentose-5-phosphate-3-epimerase
MILSGLQTDESFVAKLFMVLIMTAEPRFVSLPFMMEPLHKVQKLRHLRPNYLNIEVDDDLSLEIVSN